ncbi:hypothetical protein A2110_01085 [Candidatus Jorgensenbacteria bacterium GWA1_54_12]|uniref:GIY-YIG domain-containing protein n=1 Tax=Candidatus Jorgensenbacteria bacterium GWA1_54_12 TaxID=1798468 RepID=A0A1F6BIX5_9BACT|nr:MAG: hypothetical protein A2110_01085 [Candidatus Jorgensenbacteria bacterium GWA1_54_12]
MYSLYVLKDERQTRHYIGITDDVDKRLRKHNTGGVKSTKPYKPWRIAYVEKFETKYEARKREIFLKKTTKARKELFNKIDKGPIV